MQHAFYGNVDRPLHWAISQAIHIATKGKDDLLVVAPTGAGKTALVLGLPLVEDVGITVVVAPLKALARQLQQHCNELKLRSLWMRDNASLDSIAIDIRVVIVSPEDNDGHLQAVISHLIEQRRLRRIVIDEVHLLLTSDYREAARRAIVVRTAAIPILALSATVPPALVDELRQTIASSALTVLRAPSTRDNISISIINSSDNSPTPAVVKVIQERENKLGGNNRVIVYVMSRAQATTMATALTDALGQTAVAYTAELSDEQQQQVVQEWQAGDSSIIVATTAFGVGVHYAHVRLVIVVGGYDLLSVAQQFGRGGRDGEIAEGVFVFQQQRHRNSDNADQQLLQDQVRQWAAAKGCLTQALSIYVDGADSTCLPCILTTRQRCGNCATLA